MSEIYYTNLEIFKKDMIKNDGSGVYLNEFDYDLSLINLEDEIQYHEDEGHRYQLFCLKKYLNILKLDETKKEKNLEYQTKINRFFEYDIQELPTDVYEELSNHVTAYFEDVKVLVIDQYPIYIAFKIGETYDECEFIGNDYDLDYIYKIIDNYLDECN